MRADPPTALLLLAQGSGCRRHADAALRQDTSKSGEKQSKSSRKTVETQSKVNRTCTRTMKDSRKTVEQQSNNAPEPAFGRAGDFATIRRRADARGKPVAAPSADRGGVVGRLRADAPPLAVAAAEPVAPKPTRARVGVRDATLSTCCAPPNFGSTACAYARPISMYFRFASARVPACSAVAASAEPVTSQNSSFLMQNSSYILRNSYFPIPRSNDSASATAITAAGVSASLASKSISISTPTRQQRAFKPRVQYKPISKRTNSNLAVFFRHHSSRSPCRGLRVCDQAPPRTVHASKTPPPLFSTNHHLCNTETHD